MVRLRVTRVGKLFLGLMALFYVASVTSQSGLLLLFIGLIGGCFVVNAFFARRNVRNLSVVAPRVVQLVEGESPREPWQIENRTSKHAESIEAFLGDRLLFGLPLIKARATVSRVPKLVYEERGVYSHAELTLASAAPYGLVQATRKLHLEGELVVLPRVYETESLASAGLESISGGRYRGGRHVSSGTQFAGIRAWQAGDSIKQIHWKSTARRDQLMVKTFEEELGGRLSIVLDCAGAGDPSTVHNAVRAAGSLATSALQDGHHLEFIDCAGGHLRLAPFSDEGELLLQLARYQPASHPSLDLEMLWRKSSIALVGLRWNDRWIDFVLGAYAQNRRVCLILPQGEKAPPDLDAEVHHFERAAIHPPRPSS